MMVKRLMGGSARFWQQQWPKYLFIQPFLLSSDRAVRNTEVAGLAILAGSALAHSSAFVATVRLEWRRRCVAARGVARV